MRVRWFIVGEQLSGASVTKTFLLAGVSIGTVTEATSTCGSMGKTNTSVNRVENIRKNDRAAPEKVNEDLIRLCQSTTVSQHLHREACHSGGGQSINSPLLIQTHI